MKSSSFLLALIAGLSCSVALAEESPSADQALDQLTQGNLRYVNQEGQHPHQDADRRAALSKDQQPIAAILTCSDSRVAPEIIFDQGLGDLFVIRNAGNVLDDHTVASLEYAVDHLHVPLIIVMGHQSCGAVTAAVSGAHLPGHLHSITDWIQPAVAAAKELPGDPVENCVAGNVNRVVGILRKVEPILGEAVERGKLKVVGGKYLLESGRFEILK